MKEGDKGLEIGTTVECGAVHGRWDDDAGAMLLRWREGSSGNDEFGNVRCDGSSMTPRANFQSLPKIDVIRSQINLCSGKKDEREISLNVESLLLKCNTK